MTNELTLTILIVLAAGVASAQTSGRSKPLLELAAAEREFAAFTVKEGFRDGFIKFFADDGVGFGPHPEKTKEKLMKLPPQTGQRKVIFNWAPMFGDISDAGDLGYTTGPVLYTDVTDPSKPARHGIYFSVWQKQPNGEWKVVIDMGVDTPQAVAPLDVKFTAASSIEGRRSNPVKGTPADDYRGLDWNLWGSIAKTSPAAAYGSTLDKQFRVHRTGMMPVTAKKDLVSMLAQTKFEFIDGKIASSNDLAFTYGKYRRINDPDGTDRGYYVHVWRRDADSKWRLVVDVQNRLPKSEQ